MIERGGDSILGNQPLKGVARLSAAYRNSKAGFHDIWRTDEAFRQECIVFLISIPFALWISSTLLGAALLVGSLLFVIIIEVLNSAIETVVDRIGTERHELSRIAKDLGSLAVLLSCGLAGLLWLVTLVTWLTT